MDNAAELERVQKKGIPVVESGVDLDFSGFGETESVLLTKDIPALGRIKIFLQKMNEEYKESSGEIVGEEEGVLLNRDGTVTFGKSSELLKENCGVDISLENIPGLSANMKERAYLWLEGSNSEATSDFVQVYREGKDIDPDDTLLTTRDWSVDGRGENIFVKVSDVPELRFSIERVPIDQGGDR